jgi:hypothetical protein
LQGRETDVPQGDPPEALSVDGNVTGLATHLGQFTLTYKVAVQLPDGSATGSAELIAADKVLYSFRLSGRANPPIVTHRI